MFVALEQKPGAAGADPAARPGERAPHIEVERPLLCARCGAPVTRERDRVSLFGAHEHDRVNPSGFVFRIGCFEKADGAAAVGPSSTEFPWFPKHAWQVAVCRSCFVHLGWRFADGSAAFWGLIVDALRS